MNNYDQHVAASALDSPPRLRWLGAAGGHHGKVTIRAESRPAMIMGPDDLVDGSRRSPQRGSRLRHRDHNSGH